MIRLNLLDEPVYSPSIGHIHCFHPNLGPGLTQHLQLGLMAWGFSPAANQHQVLCPRIHQPLGCGQP